jgi:hypothetical protein
MSATAIANIDPITRINAHCYVRNNGPYLLEPSPARLFEVSIFVKNVGATFIYNMTYHRFTTTESFNEVPSMDRRFYVEELPNAIWFDTLQDYLKANAVNDIDAIVEQFDAILSSEFFLRHDYNEGFDEYAEHALM